MSGESEEGLWQEHGKLQKKVADLEERFKTLVKFTDEQITHAHVRLGSEVVDELVKLRKENEDLHVSIARARTAEREAKEQLATSVRTVYEKQKHMDAMGKLAEIERQELQQWRLLADHVRRPTDGETIVDVVLQELAHLRSYPRALGDKIMSWNVTKNGVTVRVEAPNGDPRRVSFSSDLNTPKRIAQLIRALTSYLGGEFNHEGETQGSHGG